MIPALAPAMSRPARNVRSEIIPSHKRTFFATTRTSMGGRLFQAERNAMLLVDVLRFCVMKREFQLHDFVIMPDHVHLLLSLDGTMTIEKPCNSLRAGSHFESKRNLDIWERFGRVVFPRCEWTIR